ncbi:MAG: DUF6567 family protein [Verrucomicrobiota bacterium]
MKNNRHAGSEARLVAPEHDWARIQKHLALVALLAVAALASGCAAVAALPVASLIGSPNASSLEIHTQTDIRLQAANFVVTKTNVIGESKGFSLLGILTIVPAKFTTAMNRLYTQAEMQPGRAQTLANLILEKNSAYYILFSFPRTVVRADVIEFIPANTTNPPSQPQLTE